MWFLHTRNDHDNEQVDFREIKAKQLTGVINYPLGQPTVLAGSDFRLILKFLDGRTVVTAGWDCGWPRGSTTI